MNKEEFRLIFEQALEMAAQNADAKLGHPVPRRFEVEMHGLAPHPRILGKDQAFEEIYLGPDRFYRIIDIAVRRVRADTCTVYMRISGHVPGLLEQTWNRPPGSGPFKQILAKNIEVT